MIRAVAGAVVGLAAAAGVAFAAPARSSLPLAETSVHAAAAQAAPDTVFRHADHERLDCLSCHTVDPEHGATRIRTLADCRSCHHRAPLANDCARCHTSADVPAATFQMLRALELSVGLAPQRALPFAHARHDGVACASCHTEGLALSAVAVSCATCHEEHHEVDAECVSCHLPVMDVAVHPVEVHVGCSSGMCHQAPPFEGVPRTRQLCLSCHQDMQEHRPGRTCTVCHLLPPPRVP